MVDTVDAHDATIAGQSDVRASETDEHAPARVGRYVVLEQIGRGGMGIVYAAYDPELDRKIAIKLLDPQRDDIAARVRLLREAQAMAKLQHPNVVAVHDVGTLGDRVFVAMEFVRGTTLTSHLAARPRPWREVLGLLLAAGRGLAAAHEVGLVHRDFKPDNVLVSASGRVQVTDFGLARGIDSTADDHDDVDRESLTLVRARAAATADLRITRTGAMIGTPAYMAPEQYARRPSDARTDQFAFCVAAYEALYGARPFAGASVPELASAVLEGAMRPIPRPSRVPLGVGAAIARGLSTDPAQRWPEMNALLDRLERAPKRSRLRWIVAGSAGAIAIATLVAQRVSSEQAPGCADPSIVRAELWDAARRDEVQTAVLSTAVPYAGSAWLQLDGLIGAQVDALADSQHEVCVAHRRTEISSDLFDRKMSCLVRRRTEIITLLDVLMHPDATAIQNSVLAASQLAPVADCDDAARLFAEVEPPRPDESARVDDLRARIDAARVIADTGRVEEARVAMVAALAEADELGYRPLLAEAHHQLGWITDRSGDYPIAERELQRAWWDALATGHSRIATRAAADLVLVIGVRQTRMDEGVAWGRDAEALLQRHADDDALAAHYHANVGNLYRKRGDTERAISELKLAVALEQRRLGEDSPAVARQITALGLAYSRAGDYESAREQLERARDLQVAVLGSSHPDVATTLNNLGQVYYAQGRDLDSLREHERALEIRVAALGASHPDTASSHTNLGGVLRRLGRWDEATEHLRRAIEIKTRALGPDDPQVADAVTNLGNVDFTRGDFAAAEPSYRRALDIYGKALGPEHIDVAAALNNLGTVQWKLGQLDAAEANLGRALAIWERALGREHPDLAATLLGLGEVALARGDGDAAARLLERAIGLLSRAPPDDEVLAKTRFALARALQHRDAARAFALAEQARDRFARAGEPARAELEKVEAFLQTFAPRKRDARDPL